MIEGRGEEYGKAQRMGWRSGGNMGGSRPSIQVRLCRNTTLSCVRKWKSNSTHQLYITSHLPCLSAFHGREQSGGPLPQTEIII